MILIIDNYDSFTYNLVQYLGILTKFEIGNNGLKVVRNDRFSLPDLEKWRPQRILISPGPGLPTAAGLSVEVIRKFGKAIPILGICLGHQAMATAYGGAVIQAHKIVHGKTSEIHHSASRLFKNIPSPFTATRYHSLVVDSDSLPGSLRVTSKTVDGVIMSLEHKTDPVFGVQFHPESIATKHGLTLIGNFLEVA